MTNITKEEQVEKNSVYRTVIVLYCISNILLLRYALIVTVYSYSNRWRHIFQTPLSHLELYLLISPSILWITDHGTIFSHKIWANKQEFQTFFKSAFTS